MEPPHGLPESSSPVVLLPARPEFTYVRTEVTANSGTRTTTARIAGIDPRRIGAVTTSTSSVRTNNSFSVIGSHGNAASATGPTTRSRLRSHATLRSLGLPNAVRSMPSTAAAPPSASATSSRKRKTPTRVTFNPSQERRCKAPRTDRNRKKPPPGADLKKAPPAAKSDKDDDKKPEAVANCNCCICMGDVEPCDVAKIDGCDHRFCFGCIEKWSERENKCPLCKTRFHKIERVQKKKGKGSRNAKRVKQKDQRSEFATGAALEGLLANLHRNSGSLARIIFGASMEFGHRVPTAAIGTARGASGVRAEFTTSSDEDSDDESPMAAFMRALHGSTQLPLSSHTTVVRPISVHATHFSARSFARNTQDSTAGRRDNPLEIDDSSVEDEEEEVIEIDD